MFCRFYIDVDSFHAISFNIYGLFCCTCYLFIFFSFEIIPSLSDVVNFHSATSLMSLARSGDCYSPFVIDWSDDSTTNYLLVTRESRSLIYNMLVMVSCLVLMSSRISSVRSIILFYFMNLLIFFLYSSLMSFDCSNRLEGLLMLWHLFWRKVSRSISMKVPR